MKKRHSSPDKQDEVSIAFDQLEHVFVRYNNSKIDQSNRHPAGHPDRVEHDFRESEKEHLALLRSKLNMEIANKINATISESADTSDRLGTKVFWLNIIVALLTAVLATSAVLELGQ